MQGKVRGLRVRLVLISTVLSITLGISILWITEMPNQTAPQPSPTSESVTEKATNDLSDPDDSSAGSDGLGTSSAEESCDPPDTFPDLDLLDGEYLEYVEIEECNWDLVLWNEEGTGTSVDLENPCGPFPDDPEDPNYFYIELITCEYTLVFITDRGELELVNPSEAAREAWDSGIGTTEETFAAPPPTSSGGSGSSQQSSVNSPPPATTEPSQEEAEAPIRPPSSPDEQTLCPQTREENPEVYDACREGFVPPTHFDFTGILKCSKTYEPDPPSTGGLRPRPPGEYPVYQLTIGLVLKGGNFRSSSIFGFNQIDSRTATTTFSISGLQDTPFDSYSMPIKTVRDQQVLFWSMDDRYHGVIHSGFYSYRGDSPYDNMIESDLRACN